MIILTYFNVYYILVLICRSLGEQVFPTPSTACGLWLQALGSPDPRKLLLGTEFGLRDPIMFLVIHEKPLALTRNRQHSLLLIKYMISRTLNWSLLATITARAPYSRDSLCFTGGKHVCLIWLILWLRHITQSSGGWSFTYSGKDFFLVSMALYHGPWLLDAFCRSSRLINQQTLRGDSHWFRGSDGRSNYHDD